MGTLTTIWRGWRRRVEPHSQRRHVQAGAVCLFSPYGLLIHRACLARISRSAGTDADDAGTLTSSKSKEIKKLNAFLAPFRAFAFIVSLVLPLGAWAQQVVFTVEGTFNEAGFGYIAGQPFQFNFFLNNFAPAPPVGNISSDVSGGGAVGWIDNAPGVPQVWSTITGTGLTGSWTPTITSASQVAINISGGPVTTSSLSLYANSGTGMQANGFTLTDLQVGNVYQNFFITLPNPLNIQFPPNGIDPTQFFLGHLGTYQRDIQFSPYGRIYAIGTNGGGQVNFTANTLTIAAVVPEPETWAMLLTGLGLVCWIVRRRLPACGLPAI